MEWFLGFLCYAAFAFGLVGGIIGIAELTNYVWPISK